MLNVGIVGAGISGLTCALFLRHLGYIVTIYEKNAALSEAGAGIQIPPNACAQLAKIPNLLSRIKTVAFEPDQIVLRRYSNGEALQTLPCRPVIETATGFPYLLIHRARYQQILYEAATDIGVKVVFDVQITSLDIDLPALIFKGSGKVVHDLIIGADGVHSFCRRCIASTPAESAPVLTPSRAYRALLPLEVVKMTTYGKRLVESRSVFNWLGPRRHIVAYPISEEHLNLVLVHPGPAEIGLWDQVGSVEELRKTYQDFDPDLQSILNLVTNVRAWKILEAPKLRRWGSENGKIILIGDAAHAMVPYMAQGAAQSVEDAAVLARCLATMKSRLGLQGILDSFEALRRPRASRIVEASRANGVMWELEDGPEQQQRDQLWKSEALKQRQKSDGRDDSMQNVEMHNHEDSKLPAPVRQTTNSTKAKPGTKDFRTWLWVTDVSAEADAYARKLGIDTEVMT